jgi:hypothetical protein
VIWLALFGAALMLVVGWPPAFPQGPGGTPTWSTIKVSLGSPILATEWLLPAVGVPPGP